jgi:hypothetical protein
MLLSWIANIEDYLNAASCQLAFQYADQQQNDGGSICCLALDASYILYFEEREPMSILSSMILIGILVK